MDILELMLADWLSPTDVTTLVDPKLVITSMCFRQKHVPACVTVQVEAMGSGAIVVPSFSIYTHTTMSELFECVQKHFMDKNSDINNTVKGVRLFHGETELINDDTAKVDNFVLTDKFDFAQNDVLHAVVVTTESMLAKRTLLILCYFFFCFFCFFRLSVEIYFVVV